MTYQDLPLFAALRHIAGKAKRRGAEQAAGKHDAELERLVPVFRELMAARKDFGLTIGEFRHEAVKRGLLPLKGEGRELSYLTVLPTRAGGLKNGQRRLSPLPGTRNLNDAYSLPEFVKA